jgi:FAD/FMN-containing dehydrogenase
VRAEGGREADVGLAETWWKRRHSAEPWPGPPPNFQVTATPSKLRGAYHAVRGAVAASGATARAHISRFDVSGAVLFFTFDASVREAAEAAARAGGGWLLGARARELDPYLVALRAALDPDGIMNPGALTS